jgi:vitamin B12 transporter
MKTNRVRAVVFSCSLLFLLFFTVSGQSQTPPAQTPPAQTPQGQTSPTEDARLSGRLLDAAGAGVGSVSVTAQAESAAADHIWKATSATDGSYALQVPPGRYNVRFARAPFQRRNFSITLAAGESRTLDISLTLEPLSSSVVVTAQAEPALLHQTTAPVTVITREEIDRRQAVSLPDLLLFTPGTAIGRTGPEGGTASVFLNGGNSNFTKVLVDGTPLNEPGSAVDFSNFTTDNIEKVEIVRGAESAQYGTDAVAGVVQVFTRRGNTRTPELGLFAEGGSFGSGRGGAQLSGLLGSFDYSGAYSYSQTDGQGPNDGFLNRTASGNLGYRFSENNRLRLTLRNTASNAGTPGQTLFLPPSRHALANFHAFSSGARWNFNTGRRWQHEISGAESYHHDLSANPRQSFFATDPLAGCPQTDSAAAPTAEFCDFTFTERNQYNRASFSGQSSYLLPKFGATAGYQYEVENVTLEVLNREHFRRNSQGGFLDFRYQPHPRATLNFGARAEANGVFGTRVAPRAGASLLLRYGKGFWGETRYRIFYGQGIKEPRFDQSFGTDPCFPGNPGLRPEQSKTWSTGVEQKVAGERVSISADYFSNRFYDIVSFEFCLPGGPCPVLPPPGCGFGFGTYFNTDLARARGTNIAIEARPARWLSVAGNYTYNDSRVLASPNAFDPALMPGNRLIRRPPHSGSVTINAGYRRWTATLAGYFSGVRTDSDFLGFGLTRNPGYARFDLATRYSFNPRLSLYARATNLFDKVYQDALGYPALGRDVRIGVHYRFGGVQ